MEFVNIGQFIAAFAFVVGLIGIFALVLRKFRRKPVRRRREGRLQVVETLMLDAKSQLFLIRRDDIEHLVIRSGDRFEVVETHIETEEMELTASVMPSQAKGEENKPEPKREGGFLTQALAQADELAEGAGRKGPRIDFSSSSKVSGSRESEADAA